MSNYSNSSTVLAVARRVPTVRRRTPNSGKTQRGYLSLLSAVLKKPVEELVPVVRSRSAAKSRPGAS